MITSEDLKNIFYSGYKEKISSKKDYFESIDQVKVIEGLGPQGRGKNFRKWQNWKRAKL